MSNKKIIIVEDEMKIAKLLADYLKRDGFIVTIFEEGSHVVEKIKDKEPALLILDLMLPGKDGLTICREVRQFSLLPIIMITAKIDEIDRLIGLELGADDYICKPFSHREVVARVKTILRRVEQPVINVAANQFEYRNILIDLERFQCEVDDQRIELTRVEFRILQALMTKPGRVLSRDHLMTISYDDNRIVSDRTVDSHVKNLRKKLSLAMNDDEIIHTIYGIGYKLE